MPSFFVSLNNYHKWIWREVGEGICPSCMSTLQWFTYCTFSARLLTIIKMVDHSSVVLVCNNCFLFPWYLDIWYDSFYKLDFLQVGFLLQQAFIIFYYFIGVRVIFWDMRDSFLFSLYRVSVEGSRMEKLVPELDEVSWRKWETIMALCLL